MNTPNSLVIFFYILTSHQHKRVEIAQRGISLWKIYVLFSTALGHLRTNNTFKIRLYQFKAQDTKSQMLKSWIIVLDNTVKSWTIVLDNTVKSWIIVLDNTISQQQPQSSEKTDTSQLLFTFHLIISDRRLEPPSCVDSKEARKSVWNRKQMMSHSLLQCTSS